jgi:AcrR family transcriptional regulator
LASRSVEAYPSNVPKLWKDTIETHRRAVRDAVLDTAAALVEAHGLRSTTMSEIAEGAGIGRATLYKYFPDVESIVRAFHERQIALHVEALRAARDRAVGALAQLEAVLRELARLSRGRHGQHDPDVAALHDDEHLARAERELRTMIRELIVAAVAAYEVRADVSPDELTTFSLHAITGAREHPSTAATDRLVDLTLAALRPPT